MAAQYRIEVAREGLRLMQYAGQVLRLSSKGLYLNRCAIAKYKVRYGIALVKHSDINSGFKMILNGFCSEPSIIWNHSVFRSRFQASIPTLRQEL